MGDLTRRYRPGGRKRPCQCNGNFTAAFDEAIGCQVSAHLVLRSARSNILGLIAHQRRRRHMQVR
jgi:hypothetical protein